MPKNNYIQQGRRCIKSLVAIPEDNAWRIYVAWENKAAADRGEFRYYRADGLYLELSPQAINNACDFGTRITKEEFIKLTNQ